MFKKSVIRDVILFIAIALILLVVVPAISSLLKQLVVLQIVMLVAGVVALRYLVQKIRGKIR